MSDWSDDEMEARRAWLDEGPWLGGGAARSKRRGTSLGGMTSMGKLGSAGGISRPRGVEVGPIEMGAGMEISFGLGRRRDPIAERLHELAVRSGYLGGREVPWRISTVEGLGAQLSVGSTESEAEAESRPEPPAPGAALRYAGFLAGLAELHRDAAIGEWLRLLEGKGRGSKEWEQFGAHLAGGKGEGSQRRGVLLEGCIRFVGVLANSLAQMEGGELGEYAAVHADRLKRFLREGPAGDPLGSGAVGRTWAGALLDSPRLTSEGDDAEFLATCREELAAQVAVLEKAYGEVREGAVTPLDLTLPDIVMRLKRGGGTSEGASGIGDSSAE